MYTKEQAISIVTEASKNYKKYLSGKNFLFVCMNKSKKISYVEVQFTESRFLHLTGLKVDKEKISSHRFFKMCYNGYLSPQIFEFAKDGTTELKLKILPLIMTSSIGNANMFGDYNNRNPKLYTEKIAGGVKAGIGFVKQKNLKPLVPNTLINADIREYVKDNTRIIATYRKEITNKYYSEIVYQAKKIDWSKMEYPPEINYLQDLPTLP
ncbi:MAG: PBECR4 domain-containing protein [Candidatus Gastranaerophilales bacterium]|nr:PBECR4 domain-containing protein [Candidatus Gastranaerophilales bacterium]